MKNKFFSGVVVVLVLALTGAAGCFVPEAVLAAADRELRGVRETVDMEKISLSYETEPDICRKLWLVANASEVGSFQTENTVISEGEAAGAVLDFVSGFMGETKHMLNIYAEPKLTLFSNGESLVLWTVVFHSEEYLRGFFVVDDESGYILGFELLPEILLSTEDAVLDQRQEGRWDLEKIAQCLCDSYGIPGAYYAENRVCIPRGEGEYLETELFELPVEGVLFYNR